MVHNRVETRQGESKRRRELFLVFPNYGLEYNTESD
jgi:hypothetical protein